MARVLHIEDDPANRLLVRKLLQSAGHEVIDAADGLEGIRLACSIRPDLVLVDLNIPGLDGFEVTLRLKGEASLAGIPIVAITAEGDRETSLAVGCDGFLQKPIDARSFAQLIGRYLQGAREIAPAGNNSVRLREQSQRIVGHLEEKVAELSRANARLREVDAARTEFYRNVSHELATPMTPIVGYVKLLIDEELGPLDKPQQKALRAVDDCVRRLRAIIDNLVDVTGLETGRMRFLHKDYDVLDTTRRAMAAVADRLDESSLALVEQLPRGPLTAWGDADRLQRALVQLLENAAKFTPEGGTVGVRVARLASGHYEVCVADTGPGVPAERAHRIFDPFYQVDGSVTREHGGVGVGLAIARRTARGLGGDVRVVSPSPEVIEGVTLGGAAFYLTVAPRAPTQAEPPASGQGAPRSKTPALGVPATGLPDGGGGGGLIVSTGTPLRGAEAGTMDRGAGPASHTPGPGREGTRSRDGAYLDWNATTPPLAEVIAAMTQALELAWANPASVHGPGRRARAHVEDARDAVAALLEVDARDVILTSGGTEANNLALSHFFPRGGRAPGSLVVSRIEHPSVTRTAEALAELGVNVSWVEPSPGGVIEPAAVVEAMERAEAVAPVRLVTLMAVNHETGVIQPVEQVAALARARRIPLHVDAVQAAGRLPASAWAGADLVSIAAHKLRGPKGIGALAARAGLRVAPLLRGGAQERGVRPGTQSPEACAGLAVAADRARGGPARYAAVSALRDQLEQALIALGARYGARPIVNGSALRAPHVSNLSWPGLSGVELCAALDLEGVAVSSGSACSAGTAEPSPVIVAMAGVDRARSAVRVSLGDESAPRLILEAIASWERVVARARPRL